MLRTMTVGAAARWAGVSPRMLGLMLAGRLIDPTSELDVEVDGLPLEVVESMPGRPGVGCGVAAGAEVRGPVREAVRGARCAGAGEVHPATEEAGRQPSGASVPVCRCAAEAARVRQCRGLAGERGVAHKKQLTES